jgi:esterase/lipase
MKAITLLQDRGAERIGIGGHSLGGMLSVLVSAYDSRVDCTVAWAAPKSINSAISWVLANLFREDLREEDITEENFIKAVETLYNVDLADDRAIVPINIANLHTTVADLLRFFTDCQRAEFKPIEQAEDTENIRFMHGTADPTVNPQDSQEMFELANEPKNVAYIEGAGHGTEYGHEEEILKTIVEWFDSNL